MIFLPTVSLDSKINAAGRDIWRHQDDGGEQIGELVEYNLCEGIYPELHGEGELFASGWLGGSCFGSCVLRSTKHGEEKFLQKDEMLLTDLGIIPSHRRMNLGSLMMTAALDGAYLLTGLDIYFTISANEVSNALWDKMTRKYMARIYNTTTSLLSDERILYEFRRKKKLLLPSSILLSTSQNENEIIVIDCEDLNSSTDVNVSQKLSTSSSTNVSPTKSSSSENNFSQQLTATKKRNRLQEQQEQQEQPKKHEIYMLTENSQQVQVQKKQKVQPTKSMSKTTKNVSKTTKSSSNNSGSSNIIAPEKLLKSIVRRVSKELKEQARKKNLTDDIGAAVVAIKNGSKYS